MKPFKNTFDFGFVSEDKRHVSEDIKQLLTEFVNKHREPIIIKDKQISEEYKQIVLQYLLNFSDLSTGYSSIIFIGLYCMVFQVTFLKKGGAKNKIPGYEWIKK